MTVFSEAQQKAWQLTNNGSNLDAYYGYLDAVAGVFSKWYRKHRSDNGAEYLRGWNEGSQK